MGPEVYNLGDANNSRAPSRGLCKERPLKLTSFVANSLCMFICVHKPYSMHADIWRNQQKLETPFTVSPSYFFSGKTEKIYQELNGPRIFRKVPFEFKPVIIS